MWIECVTGFYIKSEDVDMVHICPDDSPDERWCVFAYNIKRDANYLIAHPNTEEQAHEIADILCHMMAEKGEPLTLVKQKFFDRYVNGTLDIDLEEVLGLNCHDEEGKDDKS